VNTISPIHTNHNYFANSDLQTSCSQPTSSIQRTILQKIAHYLSDFLWNIPIYLPEKIHSYKGLNDSSYTNEDLKYADDYVMKKESRTQAIVRIILLATVIFPLAAKLIIFINKKINHSNLVTIDKTAQKKVWESKIISHFDAQPWKEKIIRLLTTADLDPSILRFKKFFIILLADLTIVYPFDRATPPPPPSEIRSAHHGHYYEYKAESKDSLVIYIKEPGSQHRGVYRNYLHGAKAFILSKIEVKSNNTQLDPLSGFYQFLKSENPI
jgi:hypothetical protein